MLAAAGVTTILGAGTHAPAHSANRLAGITAVLVLNQLRRQRVDPVVAGVGRLARAALSKPFNPMPRQCRNVADIERHAGPRRQLSWFFLRFLRSSATSIAMDNRS